jgi:hypothetical protein
MTTTTKSDALAVLRTVRDSHTGDGYHVTAFELTQAIDKLAALLEARGPFDFPVPEDAEDRDAHCVPFKNSDLRALSSALRDLGL